MSLRPVADPASITYDVGASPVVGAVQFSVTMEPLTVAVSALGAPGAVTGLPVAAAIRKIVIGAGHPEAPNAAWATPPLAKQDHDTVPAVVVGFAAPESGATRSAVVGALGSLLEPPLHADRKSDVAMAKTTGCGRMEPLG